MDPEIEKKELEIRLGEGALRLFESAWKIHKREEPEAKAHYGILFAPGPLGKHDVYLQFGFGFEATGGLNSWPYVDVLGVQGKKVLSIWSGRRPEGESKTVFIFLLIWKYAQIYLGATTNADLWAIRQWCRLKPEFVDKDLDQIEITLIKGIAMQMDHKAGSSRLRASLKMMDLESAKAIPVFLKNHKDWRPYRVQEALAYALSTPRVLDLDLVEGSTVTPSMGPFEKWSDAMWRWLHWKIPFTDMRRELK